MNSVAILDTICSSSVSLQVEALMDLVDIRGLGRRRPPSYLPQDAGWHYS
jgi:hypothetical protein